MSIDWKEVLKNEPRPTHRVTEGEKDGTLGNQENAAEIRCKYCGDPIRQGMAGLWHSPKTAINCYVAQGGNHAPRTAAVNEHQTPTPHPAPKDSQRGEPKSYGWVGKPLDSECFYGYHAPQCRGCNCLCHPDAEEKFGHLATPEVRHAKGVKS